MPIIQQIKIMAFIKRFFDTKNNKRLVRNIVTKKK